ncbi:Gldg family protein [Lyngbya aestuarii]|uniref:Gldg family protein n=1 Tax=Lyngbya aestuarii TaxID=118322 RepID=UPI00403DE16A
MKIITQKKYLKYLFWLGPVLSIMGITARVVSGSWLPLPLGLLIAGVVIIGWWLVSLGSLAPEFWGKRSTQTGTNAIIATLAVVVILGLVNFLAVRYGPRVDLTENQLLTISPLSQKMVKNLEQPVKVWVFEPIANPLDQELLKNYRRYGSKLEFEFVDPQLKPGLAQKFNVQSVGEVYLEYGADRQFLQRVDQSERISEAKLTNGIARLTSDRHDKAYFLQGHGERPLEQVEGGLSQAIAVLQERNFTAQPLNLAERSAVPEDASLVVVAGPKRALFEQEVQALRNYLSTGGSVLLMLDPEANAGLDELLADWGVTLDSRIAIDASELTRSANLGPATPLVSSYGDHPITRDFDGGFSFYPLARPLETREVKGVEEAPLLLTNSESWAESNPEEQPLMYDAQSDLPGPLTLGVALSRQAETSKPPQAAVEPSPTPEASPTPQTQASASPEASPSPQAQEQQESFAKLKNQAQGQESESRLVVLGNSNFAIDGLFEQQLNSDVLLNSISWLSKRDDQILSIRPKQEQNRRINLTPNQGWILGLTSLLIVPLIGFSAAGVMWWLRR